MLVVLLPLLALYTIQTTACPTMCSCSLDNRGRSTIICKEGGIVGPLNLEEFKTDTEVIKITAPEDNMNELQMSKLPSYNKLEELHIIKSNVPQLGEYFFYGLTRLEILNLAQNNISQLISKNFYGLDNLKELYLDDNRIQSLPSEAFKYLRNLKLLSIQRNRITNLEPSVFLEIGKLKVLKLSGNNLKHLNPDVFKYVQELRSLECRGCALSRINNEIDHLNQLDLGNNEFKTLDADELKGLDNLQHLKLDGNQITAIKESTFIFVPLLKKLNLTRNRISVLSTNAFADLNNLTELDLSYNQLEFLKPKVFNPVKNTLKLLVLSGNYLKVNSLKELLNLKISELRLDNCGIANIHIPIFPDSLANLNLAGNHLTTIPSEVLPTNLSRFDISRNRFRGLDDDILTVMEFIPNLKLDKNPWSCDLCHIVPLLERTNRSETIRNIKCTQPYIMQDKKLGTIKRNELTWCTPTTYNPSDANFFLISNESNVSIIAASMSITLLIVAIIAVATVLWYSRRHAAKYYTHEDKLAVEGETIFDNHSPLFCDGELSFKFPLDGNGEKKLSISTIDEIKKEHQITNGT